MSVFALLFIAAPVAPPQITTTIDKKVAYVGDVLNLSVHVKHAEADAFEFPSEPSFSPFELVDKAASQKVEGPMITEELVFKVAAYEVGDLPVPGIDFRVGGDSFTTETQHIDVRSVVDAEQAAKPANVQTKQEPSEQRKADGDPYAIYERVYWPFYVLGGVLLLVALYMLARRLARRGTVEEVVAKSQIPPHKAALMLLRLLRDKQLLKQGKHREYYFEATEILRGYFAQRYAINALDLTTGELMEKLAAISTPGLDREGLRSWLEHADFVKYAKLEPPLEKAASMLDFFEQAVWATRPPEPKAVEAA